MIEGEKERERGRENKGGGKREIMTLVPKNNRQSKSYYNMSMVSANQRQAATYSYLSLVPSDQTLKRARERICHWFKGTRDKQ